MLQFQIFYGQVNIDFKKGYIIKMNDTLFGQIKENPYVYMSSEVEFRVNDSSDVETFSPNELSGFGLGSSTYFESIKIKYIKKRDTVVSNVFALNIVSGKIDFFTVYFPDGDKKYFLRNDIFGLTELKQITEIRGNQKVTINEYQNTLGKYMNNLPAFQDKIRNCRFHEKPIVNLISEYNASFGVNKLTLPPNKLSTDLYITTSADYYLGYYLYGKNHVWGAMAGFEMAFYNMNKFFNAELIIGLDYRKLQYFESVNKYRIIDTIQVIDYPVGPVRYNFVYKQENVQNRYDANIVEMPIFLRYNNKMKLFSPVIEAGIKPYLIKEKSVYDNPYYNKTDFKLVADVIFGAGIGLNLDKINIKYVIHAEPIFTHSLSVRYRIR